MDIKKVSLEKDLLNQDYFSVTLQDGSLTAVSTLDPLNRNYQELKAWYESQEEKPFDFSFQQLEQYEFAETVYPPEPEAEAEPLPETLLPPPDPEAPQAAEEPETFMPK